MTLTTTVRINWPVAADRLLDHVTRVAEGDPATVRRRTHKPGDVMFGYYTCDDHSIANIAGQGLMTLAAVAWSENVDRGDDDDPAPPSLVRLSIDNPYGFGDRESRGRWVQANKILPAVAEWLDAEGVPRDAWWWNDETARTWHPGTFDVRNLDTSEPRPTWHPEQQKTA